MKSIVVDKNQISLLAQLLTSHQEAANREIAIPPFVLAEFWNWKSDRRDSIGQKLAQSPLRLGMTPGEAMSRIAPLRRSQIAEFRPFHNRTTQEVQNLLLNPPPIQMRQGFVREATTHIQNGGTVFRTARNGVWDRLRSQGHNPRDFKLDSFSEALQKLASGPDNFIENKLLEFVSEGGTRSVKECSGELYIGAMENPYLRHFLHTLFWYILSYQKVWTQQHKDWNIEPKDNDWTDITLSLYAAPGDIILTEDRRVRMAISVVNPNGDVRAALATNL